MEENWTQYIDSGRLAYISALEAIVTTSVISKNATKFLSEEQRWMEGQRKMHKVSLSWHVHGCGGGRLEEKKRMADKSCQNFRVKLSGSEVGLQIDALYVLAMSKAIVG